MINPFAEVNWRPDRAERRKFALSLLFGFPVLAAAILIVGRMRSHIWLLDVPVYLAGGGVLLGALFYVFPAVAKPFYVVWYFLACCIGIVVGNLLLVLLFYGVVTAVGLALRCAGKGPILKKPNRGAETYWLDAEAPAGVNRYFRQF
jgi:hypothetical protein